MDQPTCRLDGCERPRQKGRTICSTHRGRMDKRGSYADPLTHAERFAACYQVDEQGCWLWQGYLNDHGYGQFGVEGKSYYAHRWSYETFLGAIPTDRQIDHLCRVRHCVNPEHLEPVTPLVNNHRGESPWSVNARKTHCIRGHEFTSANTAYSRQGWRNCRACQQLRNQARRLVA